MIALFAEGVEVSYPLLGALVVFCTAVGPAAKIVFDKWVAGREKRQQGDETKEVKLSEHYKELADRYDEDRVRQKKDFDSQSQQHTKEMTAVKDEVTKLKILVVGLRSEVIRLCEILTDKQIKFRPPSDEHINGVLQIGMPPMSTNEGTK